MPRSVISEQKDRLRAEMRAKRQEHARNASPSCQSLAWQKMAELFLRHISLDAGVIIASYCAFGNEMNPQLLAEALRAQGHKIALPVVAGKGLPLVFRTYEKGGVLIANTMGIEEPAPDNPVTEPDVLLAPMLAFDSLGNRLGYGGGFYDRTIAGLRLRKPLLTIGIAYAYQQLPQIAAEAHDMRLDKIVTEIDIVGISAP
jgi:5-formyltetrahydrofolate cyclo-ligase